MIRLSKLLPILILVAVVYYAVDGFERGPKGTEARPRAATNLQEVERQTIELFEQASPSVVYITTIHVAVQRNLFSLTPLEIPQGTGSGFIWNKEGYIVTNFHVVAGSEKFRVRLSDQSDWDAKFIGAEPDKDIAILKIDAPAAKLKPIPLGPSENLKVGQSVFAIGNPFGFDQTLTTGIISGLGREIVSATRRPIQGVIQTDAAINPGNSGGPLLNSGGRLIGVNAAIYSPSGAYAGIGFAVPSNTVARIVPQIIQYGKARKPGLGVEVVDDWIARRLGISRGVMIGRVDPNSPAGRAGLQGTKIDNFRRVTRLGDIIVQVDRHEIDDDDDLFRALDSYAVGDTVTLSFVRNGKERKQVKLKLTDIS